MKKKVSLRKRKALQTPPQVEENAAGIDVGAPEMFVAVPPDRDAEPVRVYRTFTCELNEIAEWLLACGIKTVAMESTGVYWIPLYQILADRGIKVCLVNARHMRNVPGRRTDWHECQWLQYLHSVGLLRGAFRPEQEVCAIRSVMRHRGSLVEMASQHILHVHKALTQMNLQIHHVISDITGVTGKAIVEAILAGQRDAAKLAQLRGPGMKADEETIRKSLEGDWRPEHLFTLRQSWEMYKEYVHLIEKCDEQISEFLGELEPKVDVEKKPLPADNKRRTKRNNKRTGDFRFDVRTEAYKCFGVDVTRIPGVNGIALSLSANWAPTSANGPHRASSPPGRPCAPTTTKPVGPSGLHRSATSAEPSGPTLSASGQFATSQFDIHGGLPTSHESKDGGASRHYRHRPPHRQGFLCGRQAASGIRRNHLAKARSATPTPVRSQAKTASAETWLPTCAHSASTLNPIAIGPRAWVVP
jgi:hypothetical protein